MPYTSVASSSHIPFCCFFFINFCCCCCLLWASVHESCNRQERYVESGDTGEYPQLYMVRSTTPKKTRRLAIYSLANGQHEFMIRSFVHLPPSFQQNSVWNGTTTTKTTTSIKQKQKKPNSRIVMERETEENMRRDIRQRRRLGNTNSTYSWFCTTAQEMKLKKITKICCLFLLLFVAIHPSIRAS